MNPNLTRGRRGGCPNSLKKECRFLLSPVKFVWSRGRLYAQADLFRQFQIKFVEAGERHRVLKASFSGGNGDHDYRFNELSDGQRVLIALYTLIYYARSEDYTLCIDEPENFVALPEIQPWLITLYDFCSDGELQALLVSHHPELIDYLASSAGYCFERQCNAPVRVKRIAEDFTVK